MLHTTIVAEAENIPFLHPEATVFQERRTLVKETLQSYLWDHPSIRAFGDQRTL